VPYTADSGLGDVLDSEPAWAIALRYLPMIGDSPFPIQVRHATLRQFIALIGTVRDDPAVQQRLFQELAAVPDSARPRREGEAATDGNGHRRGARRGERLARRTRSPQPGGLDGGKRFGPRRRR
jgi:hypothetical protein